MPSVSYEIRKQKEEDEKDEKALEAEDTKTEDALKVEQDARKREIYHQVSSAKQYADFKIRKTADDVDALKVSIEDRLRGQPEKLSSLGAKVQTQDAKISRLFGIGKELETRLDENENKKEPLISVLSRIVRDLQQRIGRLFVETQQMKRAMSGKNELTTFTGENLDMATLNAAPANTVKYIITCKLLDDQGKIQTWANFPATVTPTVEAHEHVPAIPACTVKWAVDLSENYAFLNGELSLQVTVPTDEGEDIVYADEDKQHIKVQIFQGETADILLGWPVDSVTKTYTVVEA